MDNDFRIIAIQPLKGCKKRFRKNLEIGKLYKFYDEFIFLDENGNEMLPGNRNLKYIRKNKKIPENLYNLENGLQVNISAVVGKNGSGKSTLLELYYAICFALACKAEIIKTFRNTENHSPREEEWFYYVLEVYKELKVALYYSYQGEIYCLEALDTIFGLSIYKNTNNDYCFSEAKSFSTISHFKNFLSEKFPYTIAINYSLYGLNSEFMGPWVERLFHKNDGYQTPLVINPFRTEGNIDVNNELHLAQTRLLTNIVIDKNNKEVNGQIISKIVYEKDDKKYSDSIGKPDYNQIFSDFKESNKLDDMAFLKKVDCLIYNKEGDYKQLKEIKFEITAEIGFIANYVFRKILKISNYPDYQTIFLKEGVPLKNKYFFDFCQKLSLDKTHITYKLRQVLNMLRFNLVPGDWNYLDRGGKNKTYDIKDLNELNFTLETILKGNKMLEIEELIPIGCYNVILQSGDISLASMSSGEQHFVHSIHSVLYHILNVDSVPNNIESKRINYPYVNIILDEIELYYHPEFQRKFVYELLRKLNGQRFNNIQGINILFSTHSPFILSDIPKENILRLKNGKVKPYKESHQTLGANIHELLYNDFFLENSFMGEFVKNKVLNLIDHLKEESDETNASKNNTTTAGFEWNDANSKLFIERIGEPVLKDSLSKLYYQKYEMTSEMIDEEIERLQNLKRKNDRN
ncbi:AAA family ATPase [Salegentibacter sp. UBA1130]|uniref:AAA family ATPase n=1 Tax=Salegentibacter sp. UBA1130 TaxID=1947451 RepID=UPI00257C40A6|nr:AAA family ATPase [Salegentibacter sp. UBA1130]